MEMEKYAVFTETEFVPAYELSISNKIVEKENVMLVLQIVRDWVKGILPDYIVYYLGNIPDVNAFTITSKCCGAKDELKMVVIPKESNIRFRIGKYITHYKTRKV